MWNLLKNEKKNYKLCFGNVQDKMYYSCSLRIIVAFVPKLKVVHISTSSSGGAGRAAYRIHEALLKKGVDSFFFNISPESNKDLKRVFLQMKGQDTTIKPPNFVERQRNRIKFRITKHFGIEIKSEKDKIKKVSEEFLNIYPSLVCETASLPFSAIDILRHPMVKQADIIHLHWVVTLLDYPSFFRNNRQPIVWTLHDMNPFQGLFHYKEDEIRNRELAHDLDEKVNSIKLKSIKKRKAKMRIVTPSSWLLEEAGNSKIFKNIKGCSIAYPIDTFFFRRQNRKELKKLNRIPANNKVFLFVAQNINVYRKGFDLLMDAFKKLNNSESTLIMLGTGDISFVKGIDLRNVGNISNNRKLRDYFSFADAFIIPSREDNLPNVMLESFSCGTPVIGFPVGGIKEHVINFKTGLLAENVSSEALAVAIEMFCKNQDKFNSEVIRKYAIEKFNEELIAGQYIKLYNQFLKKRELDA